MISELDYFLKVEISLRKNRDSMYKSITLNDEREKSTRCGYHFHQRGYVFGSVG